MTDLDTLQICDEMTKLLAEHTSLIKKILETLIIIKARIDELEGLEKGVKDGLL